MIQSIARCCSGERAEGDSASDGRMLFVCGDASDDLTCKSRGKDDSSVGDDEIVINPEDSSIASLKFLGATRGDDTESVVGRLNDGTLNGDVDRFGRFF